jgi:aralkylamine N-acetyltransferase
MSVTVTLTEDTTGVDWVEFCDLFCRVGFGEREPELARRLFAASYACCFAWDQTTLIGAARALSDGIFSSAIYDVVVEPAYQGQGVGKTIMTNLLGRLPKRSVMLVSTHGSEGFYQKLGFKRLRTAYMLQEDFGPWSRLGYFDEE